MGSYFLGSTTQLPKSFSCLQTLFSPYLTGLANQQGQLVDSIVAVHDVEVDVSPSGATVVGEHGAGDIIYLQYLHAKTDMHAHSCLPIMYRYVAQK